MNTSMLMSMSLNNEWMAYPGEQGSTSKLLENKEKEHTTTQNLWVPAQPILRGTSTALRVDPRKDTKYSWWTDLTWQLREVESKPKEEARARRRQNIVKSRAEKTAQSLNTHTQEDNPTTQRSNELVLRQREQDWRTFTWIHQETRRDDPNGYNQKWNEREVTTDTTQIR